MATRIKTLTDFTKYTQSCNSSSYVTLKQINVTGFLKQIIVNIDGQNVVLKILVDDTTVFDAELKKISQNSYLGLNSNRGETEWIKLIKYLNGSNQILVLKLADNLHSTFCDSNIKIQCKTSSGTQSIDLDTYCLSYFEEYE